MLAAKRDCRQSDIADCIASCVRSAIFCGAFRAAALRFGRRKHSCGCDMCFTARVTRNGFSLFVRRTLSHDAEFYDMDTPMLNATIHWHVLSA